MKHLKGGRPNSIARIGIPQPTLEQPRHAIERISETFGIREKEKGEKEKGRKEERDNSVAFKQILVLSSYPNKTRTHSPARACRDCSTRDHP